LSEQVRRGRDRTSRPDCLARDGLSVGQGNETIRPKHFKPEK